MLKSEIVGMSGLAFKPDATPAARRKIVRRKKREASFERRFLSARGSGRCMLEIAMVWRGTVMSVKQFRADAGTRITAGSEAGCDYLVETGAAGIVTLATCGESGWQILFNNAFDGFVLRGDTRTEFSAASSADFVVPQLDAQIRPGTLACELTGDVRAKYVFGDVSILVHYVHAMPFAAPLLSRLKASSYGPLAASVLVHFALFSVILFATSRVDALMVDRVMSTSRFAVEVAQPIEEEPKIDDVDEEIPFDDEIAEEAPVDAVSVVNTPSVNPGTGNGTVLSKAQARNIASQTGLLSNATAMNSMLSAGITTDALDNVEWSTFDANVAAAQPGVLNMTGTPGGAPGVSPVLGPNIFANAARRDDNLNKSAHVVDLCKGGDCKKRPAGPVVNPKPFDVSGSMDKRTIQKIVRQHFGELRACYEREVAKVKGLTGKITVIWIIGANGSVTKSLVKESTMHNKNVEQCVVNSISHWRFPAIKGGSMASVEYPFEFSLSK